jgi:hypothetical protein
MPYGELVSASSIVFAVAGGREGGGSKYFIVLSSKAALVSPTQGEGYSRK